jgi:hypothetical protein
MKNLLSSGRHGFSFFATARALHFLLCGISLCLLTSLASCRDKEKPCTEPIEHDAVEPAHWGMLRHQAGDTLYFKKYEIKKDTGRRYVYLGEEMVVAGLVDTPEVMFYKEDYTSPCDIKVFSYPLVQYFAGAQPISCKLIPDGTFDDLRFYFSNKDFRIDSWQYNYPSDKFFGQLNIGGKDYSNVNAFYGFDEGAWGDAGAYKDSTMCFYNNDFGVLKFIVNDALVYERYLK